MKASLQQLPDHDDVVGPVQEGAGGDVAALVLGLVGGVLGARIALLQVGQDQLEEGLVPRGHPSLGGAAVAALLQQPGRHLQILGWRSLYLEPSYTHPPRTRMVWLIVWVACSSVARNSMGAVRTESWLVGKERRVGASPGSPLLRLKPRRKDEREGAPLA